MDASDRCRAEWPALPSYLQTAVHGLEVMRTELQQPHLAKVRNEVVPGQARVELNGLWFECVLARQP
jgi:hypothetical protein